MKHSWITFAGRLRTVGIAIVAFALFLASTSVFAAGDNKTQCVPHTAVTKNMIVASLSNAFTPVERIAPIETLMEKQTVAPRSEWIRVAPLVNECCDQNGKNCKPCK
jgi:PBP1b-binding outer membrane lipoprotein LpoB